MRIAGRPKARDAILLLTQSPRMAKLGTRYGMRLGARRFVAGVTLEECVAELHALAARGLRTYTIMLGESVASRDEAGRVTDAYVNMAERLGREPLDNTMAIKLTHLGLLSDPEVAFRNARRIVAAADGAGMFVRIDMEESRHVDAALDIHRRLLADGLTNTGVVVQAYLHRAPRDLEALLEIGANVRIVKGAYLEPASVAHARKADVDRAYCRLVDDAIAAGGFTAIATHDDAMIAHAERALAGSRAAAEARYEFQLLYGVRSQLQQDLVARGHPVRVCAPFGTDWYVYFGRRLAERPANVWFVVRSLLRG
jgi:proline dehydrogenase